MKITTVHFKLQTTINMGNYQNTVVGMSVDAEREEGETFEEIAASLHEVVSIQLAHQIGVIMGDRPDREIDAALALIGVNRFKEDSFTDFLSELGAHDEEDYPDDDHEEYLDRDDVPPDDDDDYPVNAEFEDEDDYDPQYNPEPDEPLVDQPEAPQGDEPDPLLDKAPDSDAVEVVEHPLDFRLISQTFLDGEGTPFLLPDLKDSDTSILKDKDNDTKSDDLPY